MKKFSLVRGWPSRLWPVTLAGAFALWSRGDTIVVTNTANNGPGSFQQALLTANTNPGLDTIVFQITNPPFTITPTNALPQIGEAVVIDATTQTGYSNHPVIELNGSATTGTTIGLRFGSGSDGSTLRGMAINRFPAHGIDLSSESNVIQRNFIGTDVNGTLARGNGVGNSSPGIYVKSSGNLIGGTNAGEGNLVSGGNYVGIYLQNANNNIIQGNLIGVNAAGTAALGNTNNGILVNPGSGNLIGGPVSAARNLIAGNSTSGIYLNGAATTGNVMQGNRIGTTSSGSNALGNIAGDGITLNGAPGNVVWSNLISANGQAGVSINGAGATGNRLLGNFIGTDVNGRTNLGNHYAGVQISGGGSNQLGGTNAGEGNVISGNVLDGITLTNTSWNLIQGNLIGLSAAGTNALRNNQNGIGINGASSNIIGGVVAGARNVISGNSVHGVGILRLADSGNAVLGNYIGTDITGSKAIANTQAGVQVQGRANTIGGNAPGAGNVISGNGEEGIYLAGSNGNVAGNVVQGNLIGLDATGTQGLGNFITGIGLAGAANNVIGGTSAGARNVISANGNNGATGLGGVFLVYAGTTNNQLLGNYIGTDVTGTLALGNFNDGVALEEQSFANIIGGSAAGAGNVIAASAVDGIFLTNSSGNVIQGNFIGTKADGTSPLGNALHNVELQANATNNTIGGVTPGAGNHIAFAQISPYTGVRVRPGSVNNLISGNSIFSNAGLGIDLQVSGVTANTSCETGMTAANANFGQNYPTLSNVYSGTSLRVRGSFNSKISRTYMLQFFASPAGDTSGSGEGQVYLGQTNWTLGASSCSSNFTAYFPATVPAGWVVAATATDPNNNTSEFSAWVPILSVPPVQIAKLGPTQFSLSWTNNGGSFALQQTFSLTPPILWLAVTNTPVLVNNFMVTTLAPTNSSVFYRLTAP